MRILLCLLSSFFFYYVIGATECGLALERSNPHQRFKRIVGGELSRAGVWPWHVALLKHKEEDGSIKWAGCGGTMIGSRWVLTAAHCFLVRNSNAPITTNYSVLIGATYALDFNETESLRSVVRIIRHPEYQWSWSTEDIALLELDDAPSNDSFIPVCLPSKRQNIPLNFVQAIAIGYGATKVPERGRSGVKADGRLREVSLTVHSRQHCARHGPQFVKIFRDGRYLCSGDAKRNTFRGDSGGPLMMKATDGRWFQIGITSAGSLKSVEPYNQTAEYIKVERRKKRRLRTPRNVEGSGFMTEDEVVEGSGETHEGSAWESEGSGEEASTVTSAKMRETTTTPQSSTSTQVEGSGVEMTESEELREEEKKKKYVLADTSFTNLLKYCDWIEEATEGEVKCPEEEVLFQSPSEEYRTDE